MNDKSNTNQSINDWRKFSILMQELKINVKYCSKNIVRKIRVEFYIKTDYYIKNGNFINLLSICM